MTRSRHVPAGLSVAFVALDQLAPYAANARTHSDEHVARLAAAISEWGFTSPIVADADGIVAGHGRALAARQLYDAGETIRLPDGHAIPPGTVPVIDCTGWSEAQRRAYVIADNRLAELAGWDESLLKFELEALDAGGFDVDLIGYDASEIAELDFTPTPRGAPEEFALRDENIETEHRCPKCGYVWSGSSR